MATPTKHPLLSHQPLRLIFQLSYICIVLLQLPYYAFISIIPWFRPNRKWTAQQTFTTRLVYRLLDAVSRVGITETLTLTPGREGKRFQIIPVSNLDVYKGPLESKTVKPAKIGGTWFPDFPGNTMSSKTVVLYFHGGGFVQGDGRTEMCGPISKYFLEKGSSDAVFSVQYRLSGYGGRDPFPAALQDALSSYLFLLNDLRVPPRQVILSGDSAGGNLIAALLRYLSEYGTVINVPTPKCAVLLSPWVEPFYLEPGNNPNYGVDFVPATYGAWGAHSYAGKFPHVKTKPYISPLGHPFSTPVPLFVNAGTSELFYDMISQWSKQMGDVKGNVVKLNCEEDAVHDTFLLMEPIGFKKSAWDVAAKVAEFVKKL